MNNFIIGFLLGRKGNLSVELKPSKETLNRHNQIFNYVKENPYSSCAEISLNLNLTCSDVNASLIKLWKERKIQKTESKTYFI